MKLKRDLKEAHRFSQEVSDHKAQQSQRIEVEDNSSHAHQHVEHPRSAHDSPQNGRKVEKKPSGSREGKIDPNKVVMEYLVKQSFTQTLDVFCKELGARQEKIISKTTLKALLTAFDEGSNREFFELWNKTVNDAQIKEKGLKDDLNKLEFYFQIYFCVYWIHEKGKNLKAIPADKISEYRNFLETKGADLSKTNEFLSFYALPYIKDVRTHTAFAEIMTVSWVETLRDKIVAFLKKVLRPLMIVQR